MKWTVTSDVTYRMKNRHLRVRSLQYQSHTRVEIHTKVLGQDPVTKFRVVLKDHLILSAEAALNLLDSLHRIFDPE